MKLISWNVNGLRACVQKGFADFFKEADADIFCVQETKLQEGQIDLETPGYHQYWNYAVKKGYSGTAVFTKEEPLSVSYGIGMEEHSILIRDLSQLLYAVYASEVGSTYRGNDHEWNESVLPVLLYDASGLFRIDAASVIYGKLDHGIVVEASHMCAFVE